MALGAWGEKTAARYLQRRKCKILYCNYRGPHGGEIDIICRDQETLIFVEVKTRRSEIFFRPIDAVNKEKRKLIKRGALSWLRLLRNPDITFRFDVVEVIAAEPFEVRWIQNVFQLPEPFRY